MKYEVKPTRQFQKDLKRLSRRGYDINRLTTVIKLLAAGEPLPADTLNQTDKRSCQTGISQL